MDVTALRQALVAVPAPARVERRAGTENVAADRGGLRREIQALRAFAVALVVGWHLWPDAIPGGFVGVDVFLVISGFLITALLLREVERTGRVSLRAFWARRARRILPAALTVIGACAGATAPYFATTTRGWELGAGALLALLPQRERSPAALRALLSWIGLAAIAVAAFAYSDATPFPGTAAALPVLGAVAVIRAGAPAGRLAPTRLLRIAALQRLGDLSYAVYLWHWPLIVLAPYALDAPLDTPTRLVIIMLTLLLSAVSKVLIEEPVRRGRALAGRRTRWTFAAAAAATLAVLALTTAGTGHVQAQIRADARITAQTLEHRPKCFGAAARDPQSTCVNPTLRRTVVPTPVQAPKMDNAPCEVVETRGRVRACAFGADAAPGVRTVALIGDSHASHWRSALAALVKAKGRRGMSVTHTSCPYSAATAVIPEPGRTECLEWKRDVRRWLGGHPEIDTVFFGEHSGGEVVQPPGKTQWTAQVDGYASAWKALPASVQHVLVFRDTPKMRTSTMGCVQRALDKKLDAGRACARPRGRALERDPAAVAAAHLGRKGVATIDLTRLLCDRRRCFPVIGGALVYKDIHHLTSVFATTLAPYVEGRVNALGLR
ncbi:MAG TPA: acyltransferase family protein [Baekduia sp.]|nr:acyltransferase family protein [Baekduia sp.]